MKKHLLSLSSAFIMLSSLTSKSAFALISVYAGGNLGSTTSKVTGSGKIIDIDENDNQISVSLKVKEKNVTSSLYGIHAGIEANLLLMKVAVEAFADKSFGTNKSETIFSAAGYEYENGSLQYQKPLFLGIKGKTLLNLIIAEPYLALGIGQERAKITSRNNEYSYNNAFGLVGIGVQAKLMGFGLYGELNYLQSLSSKKVDSIDIKTRRMAAQIGARYYFI